MSKFCMHSIIRVKVATTVISLIYIPAVGHVTYDALRKHSIQFLRNAVVSNKYFRRYLPHTKYSGMQKERS